MKLTAGVNLTNILRAAFKREDPKRDKRQSSCNCQFALWGSLSIKAVLKMLVKSIPGLDDGVGT